MAALHAPLIDRNVGNALWAGVKASEPWTPPAPYADQMVSVGGDGVHARYSPEKPRSVAEQIADMVNRHR